MAQVTLRAQIRESRGKGAARRLRRQGRVPGVFYYRGEVNFGLSVDEAELQRLLRERHSLVSLEVEGQPSRECILRDIQRHPVSERILHVDLMGVSAEEKLRVTVPLRLVGTPVGVKGGGGILQHGLTELEVECLPRDIPEHLEVDVSDLAVGHSKLVKHLSFPGLRIINDLNSLIATVQPPTVIKEAAPAAPAAAPGEAAPTAAPETPPPESGAKPEKGEKK